MSTINKIYEEIGYIHLYLEYWSKDIDENQKNRVQEIIKKFADNLKNEHENEFWLMEILEQLQEETENFC